MRRSVSCHVECTVSGATDIVWSVAVAEGLPRASETLTCTLDGVPIELQELSDGTTRLHRCLADPARQQDAPTDGTLPTGQLVLDYEAVVDGEALEPAVGPTDEVVYLRPSRYVEVDTLSPVANDTFRGLAGKEQLDDIVSWVNQQLQYVSGSSRPTDGAVHTYLAREGVCRDFAHLVIAMLRARNVPARLASVYAPGLDPMDFHAVAEVLLDGRWQIVDATLLAPRQTLVRIATGRDASDTAFLTTLSGGLVLDAIRVSAVVDPALPNDDTLMLTQLR